MKILVTGGAGFIGSALIRYLIQSTNDTVLNVDNLTYAGNLESLKSIENSPNYHFIKADVCDFDKITAIVNEFTPDAIMHLAAESHVDRSIDGPTDFINTNIIGTFNLLEVAKNYWNKLSIEKQSLFKFHHISTDEVYGDLGYTSSMFTESSNYSPSSPYAASKAASDHLVRAWNRTYSLPTIITNCSNNYGPYHFPEKLIPLIILNALKQKSLPIYGNGKQIRDWLYVDDHARALHKVITEGEVGETYNIGGFNEKTNLEVVQGICAILDEIKPSNIKYSELITFVDDRPGHDVRYAIDSSKIADKLNWKPLETFETGLKKTVEWYLNNGEWVENVLNGSYRMERLGNIRVVETE